MAKPRGLYTPVYASLPKHAKVVRAAELLVCDRIKLVGHLVSFWTWCLTTSEEVLTARMVALGAEWPDRSAVRFAEGLADAGLLERVGDGYHVHEWEEYGGKVADIQVRDRDRHAGSSTVIPQRFPGTSSLDETRREKTREDEKKEPDHTQTRAKPKRVTEVDADFRAEMAERFKDQANPERVNAEIDDALGHKAADKRHDMRAYVRNWLSRTQWSFGASKGKTYGDQFAEPDRPDPFAHLVHRGDEVLTRFDERRSGVA